MKKTPFRIVSHYPDSSRDNSDEFHLRFEQANLFMVSQSVKHLECSKEQLQTILNELIANSKKLG